MTIRNLFHAFAKDTSATLVIYDQKYYKISDGPIYYDSRMVDGGSWDEDIELFEKYADRLIDEWYVTCDGVIRIKMCGEI